MLPGRVRTLVAALAFFLAGTVSAAETRVSLAPDYAPAGEPGFLVRSPDVRGDGFTKVALSFEYALEPLVLTTASQDQDRVVREQAWLHAQGAYTIGHRWLVGIDVPVLLFASGDAAPEPDAGIPRADDGVALGDPAVAAHGRLLGPAGDGVKAGIAAKFWVPVGSRDALASDGPVRARLAWLTGGAHGRLRWSTELGFGYRPARALPGVVPVRVGPELLAGAMACLDLDAARALTAGLEAAMSSGVTDGARLLDARSTGLDLLVSTRLRPGAGAFQTGIAAGPGIGARPGTPDYRVIALVAWSPEKAPPPPDRDDDGVPDRTDSCPELPGVPSSDPAMNGCPEVPRDEDGDAIPDSFDACPREPGEPTGDGRTHGCPKLTDVPPPPPPPRAALEEKRIAITEQVQFETGTAVLRPESDPLLTAVARILADHPEVERVEVQGHTDDTGTDEFNRELSRQRAAAVVEWLAAHGVDRARLDPKGFGRDRPIGDNRTEEGRSRNRRVEFVIEKSRAPDAGRAAP